MPGLASLTTALKADEEAPTGSLSTSSLSMSAWKVGSFSTKSPAASTETVVEDADT